MGCGPFDLFMALGKLQKPRQRVRSLAKARQRKRRELLRHAHGFSRGAVRCKLARLESCRVQ